MQNQPTRCVNIDWLEMYVLEPSEPRDQRYFESLGLMVSDRGYGTKHWSEVFTVLDDRGSEFMEIRRKPRANSTGSHTVYPDNACNLRLVNRYCYYDTACWMMSDFIEKHSYRIRRIFRLDLAIDFKIFDSGDKPETVIRRIVRHRYTKVYQARRTVHGEDHWSDCDDNSISWGKRGSMVVTRFYNKSLELAQVKDKPYIRQAWFEAGLIDDPLQPIVCDECGRVVGDPVWRLEFQINSSARGWFVIDKEHRNEYVEHTLETYWSRPLIQQAIACLASHYFSFRIFEPNKTKYDCKEKILFKFEDSDPHYVLRNSLVHRTYDNKGCQMLRWIQRMRANLPSPESAAALDVLEARVRAMVATETGYDRDDPRVLYYRAIAPDETRGLKDADVLDLFGETF